MFSVTVNAPFHVERLRWGKLSCYTDASGERTAEPMFVADADATLYEIKPLVAPTRSGNDDLWEPNPEAA